jgi:triacylglycerol esterase/lipase EstA (alpha/beta hydrolase family)
MVIIIPGFFRKKQFYQPLSDRLQKEGFRVEIVDLGRNTKGLEGSYKKVLGYLKETPEKDIIIAHSFGGIIFKYIIFKHPEIKLQIQNVVFVSVPHGGSWSALFVSIFKTTRDLLPFRRHFTELADVSLPESIVNFVPSLELKIWFRKKDFLKDYNDIIIPNTTHDGIINDEVFISKVLEFIKK